MDKDIYRLRLAKQTAQASKDPSTKVGAMIFDEFGRVVGSGYNGFPRGVKDLESRYNDRETKYMFVQHAERNALDFSNKSDLTGCTIYVWPLQPCNECAKSIVSKGISRVVSPRSPRERNAKSYEVAEIMFEEAGVKLDFIDIEKI